VLIKATHIMCGVQVAKKLAFLWHDKDNWRLSLFYDVAFFPPRLVKA
jgi:hypothetical protein